MMEIVAAAGGSNFDWCDLTGLRFRGVRPSLFGRALGFLEFLWKIGRVDVLLCVYVDKSAARRSRIAKLLNKKVVFYWIGTDCYDALRGMDARETLSAAARADLNLGCGPSAIGELEELGIGAVEYITPPKLDSAISKMPDRHAVLISVPDGREEFYGYPALRRLIDDFSEVTFHVVRSSKEELWPGENVVFWGVLDNDQMNEVFDRVSIVVRFPEHDSTSMILMESAVKGKRLISRNAFPMAWVAPDYESLCACLREALKEPVEPHRDIHNEALDLFGREKAGNRLAGILKDVVGGKPVN